jgi:hypothetical protein
MQGMTIGFPTVSRHRSSAGFPDCEKAGLASSDINANIGKPAVEREIIFPKQLSPAIAPPSFKEPD